MSHACIHILVGVIFPVSEILLLSKTAKFSFLTIDYYSPWSSQNVINWNRLKKFMHVRVYVKCMHTNFGGCSLSSFGDILLHSKTVKFPLPWSSKNFIDWNRLKKFMHVRVYVKCMHTNFGGRGLSSLRDIATLPSFTF